VIIVATKFSFFKT